MGADWFGARNSSCKKAARELGRVKVFKKIVQKSGGIG